MTRLLTYASWPFPSPSGAHYSDPLSARLTPSQARCKCCNQFYFSIKGFDIEFICVSLPLILCVVNYLFYFFVKLYNPITNVHLLLISINFSVFHQHIYCHQGCQNFCYRKCPPHSVNSHKYRQQQKCTYFQDKCPQHGNNS